MGSLKITDKDDGHKTYEWKGSKSSEVEKARAAFEEKIRNGWMAYAVTGPHAGEVIRQFDENAEAIIMTPPRVAG